jgi:tight adherence protein B
MDVVVGLLVLGSLISFGEAGRARAVALAERVLGGLPPLPTTPGRSADRPTVELLRRRGLQLGVALIGGFLGLRLLGPVGVLAGAAAGWAAPSIIRRRRELRRAESLERQLAEVVETAAMAVRSGLSVMQALEFAAGEVGHPMDEVLQRLLDERRLGVPLDQCLRRFAETLDTDDARMFVLILSIHQRSGGNVAGALEEVSNAVHHRVAVRRELRALTAQGRVSGGILGALPIAFFLVLAASSQRDLAPVYRSPAGIAMLAFGLGLEGVAYLWIRRLLRVRV